MPRYIDAEKLCFEILEEYGITTGDDDVTEIYGMIINQPTADVFEKDLLTDRPCAVCKYNTAEKGCTQWNCVFGI